MREPGFVKAKYVTAWMMLSPDDEKQTLGPKSYWGIRIATDRGEFVATGSPRGYNQWFLVSVPVDAAELRAIAFEGYFEPLRAPPARAPGPASSTSTTSPSSSDAGRRIR